MDFPTISQSSERLGMKRFSRSLNLSDDIMETENRVTRKSVLVSYKIDLRKQSSSIAMEFNVQPEREKNSREPRPSTPLS
jgi:hypothetical protein